MRDGRQANNELKTEIITKIHTFEQHQETNISGKSITNNHFYITHVTKRNSKTNNVSNEQKLKQSI